MEQAAFCSDDSSFFLSAEHAALLALLARLEMALLADLVKVVVLEHLSKFVIGNVAMQHHVWLGHV